MRYLIMVLILIGNPPNVKERNSRSLFYIDVIHNQMGSQWIFKNFFQIRKLETIQTDS